MASIKIHAGDYPSGTAYIVGDFIFIQKQEISIYDIAEIEVADEENIKKMAGSIGWAVAGGIALGGIGALAGLLAGGNKKEITFVAQFKDNKKILATSNSSATFRMLQTAVFKTKSGFVSTQKKPPGFGDIKLIPFIILVISASVLLLVFLKSPTSVSKKSSEDISKECMAQAGIPINEPDYKVSWEQLQSVAACTERKLKK